MAKENTLHMHSAALLVTKKGESMLSVGKQILLEFIQENESNHKRTEGYVQFRKIFFKKITLK